MSLQYTVVDAFTGKAFAGNPACVIIPGDKRLTNEQMQLIAREYNLSETAYLEKKESKEVDVARYGLRWFTPTLEAKLCGHATLASSHVLFTQIELGVKTLKFDTLSGELIATSLPDGKIQLEFPAGELQPVSDDLSAKVQEAISQITEKKLDIKHISVGVGFSFQKYMLVEVGTEVPLDGLPINTGPLVDLAPWGIIVLTQAGTDGSDFASRVFGPLVGIPEDPVTGSTHCLLGPYWTKKLSKAALEPLKSIQVSPRGGALTVVWDQAKGTCRLQGNAVTVLKGELLHVP
ncbi:phenazine biosynthesis protein [Calocera viscosa TUFC12733]|uniref:Phenazine biosynthesis protein n=1 Tax=Calocera viscosa (strain TUFC12733) TaxID=1330018 RepID=A0A167M6U3_CALVF|nr:phenazine biosynthesis protein [Calocera viscosa TUFC12733]